MPSSIVGFIVGQLIAAEIAATVMISAFLQTAIRAVVGFVVSSVVRTALSSDKNKGATPATTARDRTLTIRQAIMPREVVYGRVRKGGCLTYVESTSEGGGVNNFLHLVITLASHECHAIDAIYFDGEIVPLDGSYPNGGGTIASGKWAGKATIQKSLGDEAGQPFPELVTYSAGLWTDAHRQTGHAKIYVRLVDPGSFDFRIPSISALVYGKKVADPRTSPATIAWSANVALCTNDYLTSEAYGLGAVFEDEINVTQLIAAANSCDEAVAVAAGGSEARYECHGSFSLEATPQTVLGHLMAAMAGKAVNVGGQWNIFAGVYEVPTITLDESDLAGPIRVQSLLSRRDSCNGVKGVFTDPASFWQSASFPAVASDTYMAQDGNERVWSDLDLSGFVTSVTQAQRLAKIQLLQTRQGLSVVAQFRLYAWATMTGRTVALSNTKFGWTAKAFEIVATKFIPGPDGTLSVELTLRETAAAVYNWATSEEGDYDAAPNSNLPDPFVDLDITDLTASSGTDDLLLNGDGTVVPRVRLRWTAPDNVFVRDYELQVDRGSVSPSEWTDCPKVVAPATEGFVFPVTDGETVNLRIRARTSLGNVGEWAYVHGHLVVGKTALPSDVTGANAVHQGGLVIMGCNTVTDADLDVVEVRLHDTGETNYDNASPIANILRGQSVTSAAVPPGAWELLFKARDTSGNYSANAVRVSIIVTAEGFTSIASNPQAVNWPGALTHMVRHWTGVLTPESQSLASALDWEVFDEFVPNAEAHCYYEAAEIDKSIDATARIYGDIVSVLGPGETTGVATPSLEVDTRTSSGSYDGFQGWTVGIENFRYLKTRIHVDTSIGKPVISQFTPSIDAEARVESGTLTVGAGGNDTVTFDTPFHVTPVLQVTPQGSGDVSASYASLSATGFTGYFKTAGVAGAGTMSYTATGA